MSVAAGVAHAPGERAVTKAEERRVIIASSVGTVFEMNHTRPTRGEAHGRF